MIKITQVRRDVGQVLLRIDYDDPTGQTATVWIDAKDITDRMRQFRELMGRRLSMEESRQILVKMIRDLRERKEPFMDVIQWENYLNVDLEGSDK
jgi:hypothetical protein